MSSSLSSSPQPLLLKASSKPPRMTPEASQERLIFMSPRPGVSVPSSTMPVSAAHAKDPVVAGPLGGLALSGVRAATPMMIVRAVRWYRDLARLGLHLPFFLIHDFGLLYAASKEQLEIGGRPGLDGVLA